MVKFPQNQPRPRGTPSPETGPVETTRPSFINSLPFTVFPFGRNGAIGKNRLNLAVVPAFPFPLFVPRRWEPITTGTVKWGVKKGGKITL